MRTGWPDSFFVGVMALIFTDAIHPSPRFHKVRRQIDETSKTEQKVEDYMVVAYTTGKVGERFEPKPPLRYYQKVNIVRPDVENTPKYGGCRSAK
jgi:hypothetical protein